MFITMPQLEFSDLLEEIKPVQEPKIEQMELGIEEHRKWSNSYLFNTSTWNPQPNIVFNDNNKEVGRFTWRDGVFKFEGEAETSAKLFVNHIAKHCGLKINA